MNKIIEDTIAYLEGVDLSALTMAELKEYANTVSIIRGMVRPDYLDHLMRLATSGFNFGGPEKPPVSEGMFAGLSEMKGA